MIEICFKINKVKNTGLSNNKAWPRGKPRQRWEDWVKEDLKILEVQNREEVASYRKICRDIVEAAMSLNGLKQESPNGGPWMNFIRLAYKKQKTII